MSGIKIISRPNPNALPGFKLPLHIRSAGINESIQTWNEFFPPGKKTFVQIFWTERGVGEINLRGRRIFLREGDFFYHLPGDEHRHRTVGKCWNYRWFTMDGLLAESFMRGYGYEQEAWYAGKCPVNLFLELEMLLTERTPYAQRHAISVAAEILALAGKLQTDPDSDPVRCFLRKVDGQLSDPALSAERTALELGIHRTTFTRLFKQRMGGTTPRRFLMEARMELALKLLRKTVLPLKAIAGKCGLANSAYLCRLVRRHTGMTPQEFRMMNDSPCNKKNSISVKRR